MTTSTCPCELYSKTELLTLWKVTRSTSTRLATVAPGSQFRFDTSGLGTPGGQTARKLSAVVFVAVTFRTTADTPVAGTPFLPVTWTSRVLSGPSGPAGSVRESKIRTGSSG